MAKSKKTDAHYGVFTRLLASKVNEGQVGVFAILPIKEGDNPFPMDDTRLRWISESRLRSLNLPSEVYEMYDRFGALEGDKRWAPPSFSTATMSWYIADDPEQPNLQYDNDTNIFVAVRGIVPGEELTVDYRTIGGGD